ncbi:MAG: hypothetical protein AB7P02_02555 [Alphaproteobacteria bacterium]
MPEKSSIVTLGVPRRVWAVGAVHGEADRLSKLHDALWARVAPGDRVVYLGNHLGRGPDVRRAVDELIRFRREVIARRGFLATDIVHLRGAQEEMWHKLLQIQFAPNPRDVLPWMLRQGVGRTIEAYGGSEEEGMAAVRDGVRSLMRWTGALRSQLNAAGGHVALASSLKHAAVTNDGKLLFVSSDIAPTRPLAAQGDVLWWGPGDGLDSLEALYAGRCFVVAGYDWRNRGMRVGNFSAVVDGGAGRGGAIAAACFDAEAKVIDRLEA